ncbi:ABC transporter, ATP-binding protein [Peptoniphilus sp. ING2-D1G]|nr:ABC transporter, ATP-binding protein [Peptoniphilus sp. ING2-D1G]
MKALEVKDLCKSYGDFSLKNIDFDIETGTVMGLIGSNGAGKTTLIKCILDMVDYTGDIRILGSEINEEVKDKLGILIEDAFISNFINIKETDKIFKNIYSKWDSEYFKELVKRFELPLNKMNSKFSKGMRMKYKIAVALSSRPDFLILDEPTSGLDPVVRDDILDVFLEFMEEENHSILISSHITDDLEKIADYITYIDNGELIFSKEKYDLMENYGIIKCSREELLNIPKDYIVKYRESKYSIEALTNKKIEIKKSYPDIVVDNAHIDEIMVLYKKGEEL